MSKNIKEIYIPHLDYKIFIRDIKKSAFNERFKGLVESLDKFYAICYIDYPVKKNYLGTLIHEIIHLLRYICIERNMDFAQESEHMAYLAQYIFNEIMGYEYSDE